MKQLIYTGIWRKKHRINEEGNDKYKVLLNRTSWVEKQSIQKEQCSKWDKQLISYWRGKYQWTWRISDRLQIKQIDNQIINKQTNKEKSQCNLKPSKIWGNEVPYRNQEDYRKTFEREMSRFFLFW